MYRDDYVDPESMPLYWEEPELSGIQCTGIQAVSNAYADTFNTYWFPEA